MLKPLVCNHGESIFHCVEMLTLGDGLTLRQSASMYMELKKCELPKMVSMDPVGPFFARARLRGMERMVGVQKRLERTCQIDHDLSASRRELWISLASRL